jgi:hypothetical protein
MDRRTRSEFLPTSHPLEWISLPQTSQASAHHLLFETVLCANEAARAGFTAQDQ